MVVELAPTPLCLQCGDTKQMVVNLFASSHSKGVTHLTG